MVGLFDFVLTRSLDQCGIDLKILNPARKDSGAKMFMDYLEKGVFDAFQKGFVDRIMLNIHDADPLDTVSSIVESYAFRVDYDKGRIISEEPESEIAKAMRKTSKGLAASITMAGLPPLPDAKWITFYLTYHDHTPESYEPPLFESASSGPVPVHQEKEASSQMTLCRISAPKHAMARFDGLEDDRVEEDAHQILRYAKSRGQDQVVDRFGAAEIEKFLLTYKYQHRAQEAACRVQTWWRMRVRRVKFLRVQRPGMHLLRMKRLSKRRRDVKLWVGERRQIIFEMWRRWSAFRRSRRMNEPTPVYEMDFPLWDEWLENFARMSLLKAHAAARAPRMLLLRFFRKLCSFRKRRQKKRDNEALAKQQYEESRQYYVLKHWFAHARQRGSLLRQTRRVLVTWYEWTKRKVRLRVVKRFLALNMRSDTKRVVLQKWKQRYEDAESLRMIRNDAILASGSVRSVQVALHAVFMWKQDAAHVYFVRAWWAWRRVCEGRRRWTYARFVYLRAEARRLQRIAFAAWANWLYNRRGRHGKIAKTAPHGFTTAQQLRDCLEAGSALPSQWRVEDTSDISTLSTWMTRTRDPTLAPRHDTPLHEAVDLGDLEAVRRILGTFENPAKARKMHALEKHKLRMFKQVRKAREASKKADSPLAKAKRTPEKEDPAEGETHVDVASELRAMDALGDFAVDTRNEQGLSCLHIAARHAGDTRFEIVVLLVRAGASVFAKDDEGRTPVDLATDPRTRAFLGLHAGRLEAHEFTPLEFHSYRRIRMHSTWSHLSSAGFWRVAISASCSSDASLLVQSMPRSPTYASGVLLAMGGFEGQELLRKAQQRTVEARTLAMRRILERDKVILARAVVRQQLAEAEAEAKANAANVRKGAKGKGGLRGKRRSRAVKPSAYFLHYLETTEIPHAGKINELVFREPSRRSGSAAESKARDSGSGSSRRDAAPLAAMNIFQKVLGPKPSCAWALRSAVPNRRAGASTMRAFTANLPPCSEVLRAFEDSYGGMPGDREHLAASQFEANLIAGSTISSLEGRESPDDGALGRLSAAWKLAIEVREDYLERLGDACSYLNVRKHEYLQRVADAEATIKSMDTKARSCRRSRRLTAQELKGDHERIQTELAELEAEMGITRSKMTRFQERIGQLLTELANLRGRGQANTARARALKKELVEQQEQAQQVQTQINSEERQKSRLVNATDETFNESIRRLNELESLQTEAKSVATQLREQVSSNRDKASCFKQFEEELKSLWIGARTKLDEARFKQHSPGLEFEQPPSFLENIMLDYEVVKTSKLNPLLNDHAALQAVHEDEVTDTLTENEAVSSPKTSSGPDLGLPSEEKSVDLEEPSARPSSPAASSRPNSREDSVSRRDSAVSTVTGSGSEIEEGGVVDDDSEGDDSSEAASLAIDEHGGSTSEEENLDDDDDDAEEEEEEASDDEAKGVHEVDAHRNGLDSSEDTPQSWNDTGFRSFSAKDVGPRPSREDVLMVQTYTKRSTPLDQDPILQLASPLSREHPTGRKVVARVRADEMPRTSEFARRSSVVVVRDKEHVVDRSMSMRRLDTLFTESRRLLFDGEVVDEEIKIGKAMEKERAERAKELADREKFEREAQEHLARTGKSQLEGGLEPSRADRMSILLNKNRDSIELRVKQLTPRAQQPSEDDDENALLWEEATKMKQFPELERPDFFFANFVTTSEQDSQNTDQAAKTQQGHMSLDDDANDQNEADAPSACDAEDGVDSLSQDGEIINDGETSPSPSQSQTSSNDEEKEDDEDEAFFAARMAAALKQVMPRGVAPFPAALWKSQGNAVSSKQQRALNKAQGMNGAADFFDQVDELLLAAEGCDIEDPGNKMVQGKETEIAVEKSVKLRPVSQSRGYANVQRHETLASSARLCHGASTFELGSFNDRRRFADEAHANGNFVLNLFDL
ncbi:HORMA domain-containing protein 1 [Hondaea fermentalgiana]|uniref:HORMA domain-containing protein 1 n=1 Tax=Hondaea fermentalgiana TaxID=2315210 RepID=A0A2R5G6T9_9STRA|nr:HORMA domain-containing protein 1 [Hondaea fermentalgiana]|eukprot:GBG26766.1 HORMA domain-containing protein 1 [Hondaea fermentalgiana]